MIHSDWHIHSEYSYDSSYPLDSIIKDCRERGFVRFGITDHVNTNEEMFLDTLKSASENIRRAMVDCPELRFGIELTPISQAEYDHIAIHGNRVGVHAESDKPLDMTLAVSKDILLEHGVQYVIGAAHWRVDVADRAMPCELPVLIKDWYRQQLWLTCDDRVTVLGHPWYNGAGRWYEDFSVIPRSMNEEIGAALLQYGKYVEYNTEVICSPKASEKFRYQYAEFMREYFERGIKITLGSDSHNEYRDHSEEIEKYLVAAGFRDGDFSEISDDDLWC